MWETAADFGALIVFAEHRYYGVSLPLGKDSKYYRYLSSAQVSVCLSNFLLLVVNHD